MIENFTGIQQQIIKGGDELYKKYLKELQNFRKSCEQRITDHERYHGTFLEEKMPTSQHSRNSFQLCIGPARDKKFKDHSKT